MGGHLQGNPLETLTEAEKTATDELMERARVLRYADRTDLALLKHLAAKVSPDEKTVVDKLKEAAEFLKEGKRIEFYRSILGNREFLKRLKVYPNYPEAVKKAIDKQWREIERAIRQNVCGSEASGFACDDKLREIEEELKRTKNPEELAEKLRKYDVSDDLIKEITDEVADAAAELAEEKLNELTKKLAETKSMDEAAKILKDAGFSDETVEALTKAHDTARRSAAWDMLQSAACAAGGLLAGTLAAGATAGDLFLPDMETLHLSVTTQNGRITAITVGDTPVGAPEVK